MSGPSDSWLRSVRHFGFTTAFSARLAFLAWFGRPRCDCAAHSDAYSTLTWHCARAADVYATTVRKARVSRCPNW